MNITSNNLRPSNGRNGDFYKQLEQYFRSFNFEDIQKVWQELHTFVGGDTIFTGFNVQNSKTLSNVARRYGLPPDLIIILADGLCNHLEANYDGILVRTISETIKHGTRRLLENEADVSAGKVKNILLFIVKAYQKFNDPRTRTQLSWALDYIVPALKSESVEIVLSDICQYVNDTHGVDKNATDFLFERIRRKAEDTRRTATFILDDFDNSDLDFLDNLPARKKNILLCNSGIYYTFTQEAVQTRSTGQQSEKMEIAMLDIIDIIKAKVDKKNYEVPKKEVTPAKQINKESETSWLDDTYDEVKKLLKLVKENKDISEYSLNEYLPDKLLGKHWWLSSLSVWSNKQGSSGILHVEICEIFYLVSSSSERKLEELAIEKLVKCLTRYVNDCKSPSFTECELYELQFYAINAIYSQIRNGYLQMTFRPEILETINKNCFKRYSVPSESRNRHRDEIANIAFLILKKFSTEQQLWSLCKTNLERLETGNLTETAAAEALQEIGKCSLDPRFCSEFFNEDVLQRFTNIIVDKTTHILQRRIDCCNIIHNYLVISETALFSFANLKKLIELIRNVGNISSQSSLVTLVLTIFIAKLRKNCLDEFSQAQASWIIDALGNLVERLNETLSNYVIIALHLITHEYQQRQNPINIPFTADGIVKKLFDTSKIIKTLDGIVFKKSDEEEEDDKQNYIGQNISLLAANIILNSVKSGNVSLSALNIQLLLKCLAETKDKQTRIYVAEILYEGKKILANKLADDPLTDEEFDQLYALAIDKESLDVSIFCKVVFCHCFASAKVDAINSEGFSQLAELFPFQNEILGEMDFTDEILTSILNVLKIAAKKNSTEFPENIFEAFNCILISGQNSKAVNDIVDILEQYTKNKMHLSMSTISNLDNLLELSETFKKTITVLEYCIENGQVVGEKTIKYLINDLYNDNEIEIDRKESICSLLELANINQELSDEDFDSLEIQRAGEIINSTLETSVIINSLTFLQKKVNHAKKLTVTNFEAFSKLLDHENPFYKNDTIICILMEIIMITVENKQQHVPDELINKSAHLISKDMSLEQIGPICKMLQSLLQCNRFLYEAKTIKANLEKILEHFTVLVNSDQFSDIFHIIYKIVQNPENGETFSSKVLILLIHQIRTNQNCCSDFLSILPSLLNSNSSDKVIAEAKSLFRSKILSNKDYFVLNSIEGFKALGSKLEPTDIDSIISFAQESDNTKTNKAVVRLLDNLPLDLTSKQKENKAAIIQRDEELNGTYYLKKLQFAEKEDIREDIAKYLRYISTLLIDEASRAGTIETLKLLKMDESTIDLINNQVFIGLVQLLRETELEQSTVTSIYELLHAVADFQKDKLVKFSLDSCDVEILCNFWENRIETHRLREKFGKLIFEVRDTFLLHDRVKTRIDSLRTSTNNNTDATTTDQIQNIEENVDLMQQPHLASKACEFVETLIPVQDPISSDAKKKLLKFVKIISKYFVKHRVTLDNSSRNDETLSKAVRFMSHCLLLEDLSMFTSSVLKGYAQVLKYVNDGETVSDYEPYILLIPKLINELLPKVSEKHQEAILEYISSCVQHYYENYSNQSEFIHDGIQELEKGLTTSKNPIIRLWSFDGLYFQYTKLNGRGMEDSAFSKWCKKQLNSMTKVDINKDKEEIQNPTSEIFQLLRTICISDSNKLKNLEGSTVNICRSNLLQCELLHLYKTSENTEVRSHIDLATEMHHLSSLPFFQQNNNFCNILETLLMRIYRKTLSASDLLPVLISLKFITTLNLPNLRDIDINELYDTAAIKLTESLTNQLEMGGNIFKMVKDEFDLDFVSYYKIISSVGIINSVIEVKLLISFLDKFQHKITTGQISSYANPTEMLRTLEIDYIVSQLSPRHRRRGKYYTEKLLNASSGGMTFENLNKLLEVAPTSIDFPVEIRSESFVSLMGVLNQFEPSSSSLNKDFNTKILDIVKRYPKPTSSTVWLKKVNEHLVDEIIKKKIYKSRFKSDTEGKKTLNTLIKELVKKNKNLKDFFNEDVIKTFESTIQKIRERVTQIKSEEWEQLNFKDWAEKLRENPDRFKDFDSLINGLATVIAANSKAFSQEIMDMQIICCLLAVRRYHTDSTSNSAAIPPEEPKKPNLNGLIQEVTTGGGKSTIIRILTTMQVLQGFRGIIITSNPILAERDAKEYQKLFKYFNISVGCNRDSRAYISGIKDCYKKNVVIGDAPQTACDILRDEYFNLGTMAGFSAEFLIVDEVDSLLIDECLKYTRLTSHITGMDQLQILYHFIWRELNDLGHRFFDIGNEKTFVALGKITVSADCKIVTQVDSAENMYTLEEITDMSSKGMLLQFNEDYCKEIPSENLATFKTDYLVGKVVNFIEKHELKFPSNLMKNFVNIDGQILAWVESAITALEYTKDVHYIVDRNDGKIKPVDFDTSGCVQSSTNWSKALHQFLQIEHKLPMTAESLPTNYLSTMGFITRFKDKRFFGFTGTIGSSATQKFISETYDLDIIIIPPPFVNKSFYFPDVVTNSNKEWVSAIIDSITLETDKGRGVLVVCRTIKEAKIFYRMLCKIFKPTLVKLYAKNLKSEEKHVERIACGEIIVATILAGRGTDIKTNRTIEHAGGLYLCMTFNPSNERAESQVKGRVGRLENYGTAQFILKGGFQSADGSSLTDLRNEQIEKSLDALKMQLPSVQEKDKLFQKFSCLFKSLRNKLKEEESYWEAAKRKILSRTVSTTFQRNILSAVEEQWAFLIRQMELNFEKLYRKSNGNSTMGEINDVINNANKAYEILERKMKNLMLLKAQKGEKVYDKWIAIIESPFNAISIGNEFTSYGNYSDAVKFFNHAISKDKHYTAGAFAGLAWVAMCQHSDDYKNTAIKHLEKAITLLEKTERFYLITIHETFNIGDEEDNRRNTNNNNGIDNAQMHTNLSAQIKDKLMNLENYMKSLEGQISVILKSQRRLDVTFVYDSLNNNNVQVCDEFYQVERCKLQPSTRTRESNYKVDLTFNNLTVSENDLTTKDQAINLIKIYKKDDLEIIINETLADRLYDFIKSQIEIPQQSKTEALATLNGNSAIAKVLSKLTSLSLGILSLVKEQKPLDEVDCTIHKANGASEIISNKNFAEVIKRIEDCDETFKFDLKLSNPAYKKLKDLNFGITLFNLNCHMDMQYEALEILEQKDVKIQLSGSTEDIRQFCRNNTDDESNALVGKRYKIFPFLDVDTSSQSNHISKEVCFKNFSIVEFYNFPESEAATIEFQMRADEWIELLKSKTSYLNLKMTLICTNIRIDTAISLLKLHKRTSTLSISLKLAVRNQLLNYIIQSLRSCSLDFSVKFSKLGFRDAKELVRDKSVSEEKIQVSSAKKMNSIYMREYESKEVGEFMCRGLEYLVDLNEKQFIPVCGVALVCGLGAVQIAVGTALISTGIGATVGMALVSEGCFDFVTGYRVGSTRRFSFKEYALTKTVSVSISASTLGLGAIKDAGKGISGIVGSLTTEGAEGLGIEALKKSPEMLRGGIGMIKSSLVVKQLGVSVGEAAARETLFRMSEYSQDLMANYLEDTINSTISQKFEIFIAQGPLSYVLRRLGALETDFSRMSKIKLIRKVEIALEEIVNPKDSFWTKQFDVAAYGIFKGIVTGFEVNSQLEGLVKLAGALFKLNDIASILENICRKLTKHLEEYEQSVYSLEKIIVFECNESAETSKIFAQHLPGDRTSVRTFHHFAMEYWSEENNISVAELTRSLQDKKESGVMSMISRFNDVVRRFRKRVFDHKGLYIPKSQSVICRKIVDVISNKIVETTRAKLISPASNIAITHFVSNISNYVQDNILVDHSLNSDCENLKREEYQSLMRQKMDGKSLTPEQDLIIRSYKGMTIAKQIQTHREAIKKAQLEQFNMISSNGSKNLPAISETAKTYAENIELNGHPAGLADVIDLTDAHDCKVKMTRDLGDVKDLQKSYRDYHVIVYDTDGKNTSFKLFSPNNGGEVILDGPSTSSGFKVLEHLTGKSECDLRMQRANDIRNSPVIQRRIEGQNMLMQTSSYIKNEPCDDNNSLSSHLQSLGSFAMQHFSKFVGNRENVNVAPIEDNVINQVQMPIALAAISSNSGNSAENNVPIRIIKVFLVLLVVLSLLKVILPTNWCYIVTFLIAVFIYPAFKFNSRKSKED